MRAMRKGSRGGRPFGETSYSGKKTMTRYTKSSGGSNPSMKITGRKARTNGSSNLKGRSGSKSYSGDPNPRRIKN